jgi:hypothetical protein
MAERSYYMGPYAGFGETSPERCLNAKIEDDINNSVTYILRLSHDTSGSPLSGIGTGIELTCDNNILSSIEAINLTPEGDVEGELILRTNDAGNDGLQERVRIKYDGTFNLSNVVNAGTDTDKFLVLDSSGDVDFRTGAEALSDMGAASSSHNHDHATLTNLNSASYTHLTSSNHTDLTDSGDTTLHYHAADRARASHTGTQDWGTITGTPTTLSGYGITDAASISSLTAGRVPFFDGSNLDNTTLYFTSGNFGINTDTPNHKLEILNGSDDYNIQVIYGNDKTTEYLGLGVISDDVFISAGHVGAGDTDLGLRVSSGGVESTAVRVLSNGTLLVVDGAFQVCQNPQCTISDNGSRFAIQISGSDFATRYLQLGRDDGNNDIITWGDVGIGNSSPSAKLVVEQDASGVCTRIHKSTDTSGNALEILNNGSSRSLQITHNNDNTGSVDDIVRIYNHTTEVFTIEDDGTIYLNQVPHATSDTDRIVVFDTATGNFKYRTGNELLEDINALELVSLTDTYIPFFDAGALADSNMRHVGGNVGIGISPTEVLHIYESDNPRIRITSSTSSEARLGISYGGGGGFITLDDSSGNTDVIIRSYGVTYFNGGDVGIGTDSPSVKLHVVGNTYISGQLETGGLIYSGSSIESVGSVTVGTTLSVSGESGFSDKVNIYDDVYISGKVGIKTTSPESSFDISDGSVAMFLGADSGATTRTDNTTKGLRIGMIQYDTDEEGYTIISSFGSSLSNTINIGGGTGTLNAATDVGIYTAANTTTTTGTLQFYVASDGGIFAYNLALASEDNDLNIDSSTDEIFYTASSRRFKENICDYDLDSTILHQLRIKKFNWINDDKIAKRCRGKEDFGYIAEEVAEVHPELVSYDKDGNVQNWKTRKLLMLAIAEIQRQSIRIDQLEKNIK